MTNEDIVREMIILLSQISDLMARMIVGEDEAGRHLKAMRIELEKIKRETKFFQLRAQIKSEKETKK